MSRGRATDGLRVALVWLGVVGQILGGYVPIALGWTATISHRSAELRTPPVPAGYAFSIWGLLFLWAVVLAVWQSLPAQRANPRLRRAGWWVAALTGANTLWEIYVPWRTLDWGSFVIILVALGSALAVVWILERETTPLRRVERWMLQVPLQAYAGWLSAATFVNLSASLRWSGVGTPDPAGTAGGVLILVAAAALGTTVAFLTRAWAYALPVAWALVAVVVSNLTRDPNPTVAGVAGACAAVVLLGVVAGRWRRARGAEDKVLA